MTVLIVFAQREARKFVVRAYFDSFRTIQTIDLSSYRRIDISLNFYKKKERKCVFTLQFDDKHLYHNSSNNF